MRLSSSIKKFIKAILLANEPGSKVFLFGSRTDDKTKGGDIDILWLTEKKMQTAVIRQIRIQFYKKFGWQKIDIINFRFKDQNTFKEIALNTGIEL